MISWFLFFFVPILCVRLVSFFPRPLWQSILFIILTLSMCVSPYYQHLPPPSFLLPEPPPAFRFPFPFPFASFSFFPTQYSNTMLVIVQQSIMKLSIISALSMAAIPALASSYSFICKRELYNGDPRQETAFFDVFYHEYCTRYFKCESYMIPRIQYSDRDKVITGLCLMCPPGLSTNPSGSMCTLAPN